MSQTTVRAPTTGTTRASTHKRLRATLVEGGIIALMLPGAVFFMVPFLWMISTSLKEAKYVYLFPPQFIPDPVRWTNYAEALTSAPFHLYAFNTVMIVVLAMVGQLLTASLCAYSFARIRFRGRNVWFIILLSTMMLPGQVTLIPSFLIFRVLGWVDTYYPLIVPFWLGGGAFSIFLLRQFIQTVPVELDDAAKIDGCSFFGIYWRILLPLIKPALGAVAIFSFLHHWNDFFLPVIYINSEDKWTLALALNHMRQYSVGATQGRVRPELVMAVSVVTMVPPILLFFFAQKYFIQGIVFTGLKG
jgi:ABC-type glycerol-3-phosphate transport system permease component